MSIVNEEIKRYPVTAANFHVMRGHVDDGQPVLYSDGTTHTIKADMVGWSLFDAAGARVTDPGLSAFELMGQVLAFEDRTARAAATQGSQP